MTENQIAAEIQDYILKNGGRYPDWYVGIAKDPRDRLFNGHRVREKNDCWIYTPASSASSARNVEDFFVNRLGTDGGTGGGDHYSNFVYAYKKGPHTVE